MRYLNWRTISSIGYVFGGVALLIGVYAYLYYKTTLIGLIGLTFTPYQNYAYPVIIAGIILVIIGYVAEKRAKKTKKVKSPT